MSHGVVTVSSDGAPVHGGGVEPREGLQAVDDEHRGAPVHHAPARGVRQHPAVELAPRQADLQGCPEQGSPWRGYAHGSEADRLGARGVERLDLQPRAGGARIGVDEPDGQEKLAARPHNGSLVAPCAGLGAANPEALDPEPPKSSPKATDPRALENPQTQKKKTSPAASRSWALGTQSSWRPAASAAAGGQIACLKTIMRLLVY